MTTSIKYPQVSVKLTGKDGNAFAVIGAVSGALKKAGLRDEATAFTESAFKAESYDDLLRLCMATVEVS